LNVCTIIAKNYVAYARVLARSFAEHHPEGRFWTLITDDFSEYIDPAQEPFEILTPQGVGCAQFTQMALRYSVLELSTAVKPWLLRHLLQETGGPVTYLDPDIRIFGPLDRLDELAVARGLVLTPHNSRPVPQDGRRPSQIDIMIAGVYNLGYVTLALRPEIESLLDWWADRLLRDCRVDPVWGYFVDQRWFDLAPGLVSELEILRDPEFNVAYWNLHSRKLERRGSRYLVEGQPLAFFHFSGFDPEHPLILSRHQDRIDVLADAPLEALLAEYAADVLEAGHAVSRIWPYDYGKLGDGTPLDDMFRTLYDAFSDEEERHGRTAPSPFDAEGVRIFDEWLTGQAPGAVPGVNRALAHVYHERSDLRAAYPDLAGPGGAGLISWAEEHGRHEAPLLDRLMSSPRAGRRGHLVDDPDLAVSVGEIGTGHPLRVDPWGANVIGPFTSGLEAGEMARAVVSALDAAGVSTLPVQSQASAYDRPDAAYSTAALEDSPFPVNLICLEGDPLLEFGRSAGRQAFAGRYSIGLSLWSGAQFPQNNVSQFSFLEEVWAPSSHVAEALVRVATAPVRAVRVPVQVPPFTLRPRAELGLCEDQFLFLCSFDYLQGAERMNPLGVIEAFRLARRTGDHAELVLRCVNSNRAPSAHATLRDAAEDHDITVLDRYLSSDEERSLLAHCDSFISLHHAESFGVRMAQAMWHGKPVIATGYSGNLDFMTGSNSLLVDYELVPTGSEADAYRAESEWAEPSIEHAAGRIRQVLDDRESARVLGARAARDIRRTHSPEAAGVTMGRRLESVRATGRGRHGADKTLDISPAVAALPLGVREVTRRRAAPGRARRLREFARRGILTVMRPVTRSQQLINDGFIVALMELNESIVQLRRDDAGKRAGLLSQLRQYERLARLPALAETISALAKTQVSSIDELKRLMTLETDRDVYAGLLELGRRHAAVAADAGERLETASLGSFELRVFSQNGEDGVLAEILRRTGSPSRHFVEFGVESGREGNCVYLADIARWRGLFLETADDHYAQLAQKYAAEPNVSTIQATVTPDNVEQLFAEASVPEEPDVVSIDVDGQDYWIWKAIANYRPRVVIIEYNSALDPRRRVVQPNRPESVWDGTDYYGASLGALEALGDMKGYRLVHTELSGVNAFFVRNDLIDGRFPELAAVGRRGAPNCYQRGIRHPTAKPGFTA